MSIWEAVAEPVAAGVSSRVSRLDRVRMRLAARQGLVVLLVVGVLSVAYEWHFLFRGWVPWDEGALSESAQRVLNGQLPHRDFDEIYTGGLSYLHALAFLVFGEKLASMRIVLFAFFIAWVPVLYAIARRFASPPAAGACVLACVAWSVPNYSASMPSWYNLFFATFAVAALFRYLESGRARWLVVAGLACGLSLLVKSTGIYVVVALVLALVFDGQLRPGESAERHRSHVGFVLACAVCSVVFLVLVLHRRLGTAEGANFLIPGSSIAVLLAWNELRPSGPPTGGRLRLLVGPFAWFGLGLALPLMVFVTPYLATNSLGALIHGVVVEPVARLQFAAMKPLPISSLPVSLLILLGLVGLAIALARANLGTRLTAIALLAVWLALTGTAEGFRVTWLAIHDAAILLVPLGVVVLATILRKNTQNSIEMVRTFALLAVFGFATLIQFPWSEKTYLYYVAPLLFLAALALAKHCYEGDSAALPGIALCALFLFLAVFGTLRVNEQERGGHAFIGAGTALALDRSGPLRVSPPAARFYRLIVTRIEAKGAGRYIYAGPDAPELYFLSGRANPTRVTFDFFERGVLHDRELLDALDRHRVSFVALNLRPRFSPRLDSRLLAALALRYPRHERIGRFELRWRT
jgi:4-amino-4-deoxy-L-arabinose transferase-like glycosyltransferase